MNDSACPGASRGNKAKEVPCEGCSPYAGRDLVLQYYNGRLERKTEKGSIDEKPSELNKKIWEENQKIINIVDEKTFQSGLRTRKKKPKVWGERRDFGQGKT